MADPSRPSPRSGGRRVDGGPSDGRRVDGGAPASPLPSAAPSTLARVLAVAAIVLAGTCGGLIGYGVVDISTGPEGGSLGPAVGALVGAVLAAVGVAVVAVLVLRAMTEWQTIEERARAEGREPPRRGAGRS